MHLDHVFIEIETAVDNQVRIGAPELAEVATELMTASAARPSSGRCLVSSRKPPPRSRPNWSVRASRFGSARANRVW